MTDSRLEHLFATPIFRTEVGDATLRDELEACCVSAAQDDAAGQRWSEDHGYPGYTSYASLDDLPWRYPAFATLKDHLDREAATFADLLNWDLGDRKLVLNALWINVLEPGGFHGSHLHPDSVISGTYYVVFPEGARALRYEDPRLAFMMGAPPRKADAPRDQQAFVSFVPTPGTVLLWESWLRHEVPLNDADQERITISFNYGWM